MLILFEEKYKGLLDNPHVYKEWVLLRRNDNPVLSKGDVVCFNSTTPGSATDTSPSNPNGFMIYSLHVKAMNSLVERIDSWGIHNGKILSIWRKSEVYSKIKKPYVPSSWASPVPLP